MPSRIWTGDRTTWPDRLDDPLDDLGQLVLAMNPDHLSVWASQLEPHQRALVEQIIAERTSLGWRRDPSTMAAHLDETYRRPRYVQILGDAFRRAIVTPGARQIWNLAARYGKSLTGSQYGPAWGLDRDPGARFMLISYGDELAMQNALGVRDILLAHADVLRAQLRFDMRRRDRFMTPEGGGVLARGMGAAIRGFGVNAEGALVIDDPFKDWIEAHSEATRKKKWETYRSVLRDRLDSEDAAIIHIHQRVHEDDMTGHLLAEMESDGEPWEHIVIPTIAGENDPLGREPGEVLDPERFPPEAVARRHRAMGSYLASAQEQQDPKPEEGDELRRAWFLLDMSPPAKFDAAITSWDLKLKDNEAGDFVVGQVWGKASGSFWMLDQIRGKFDHATTANAIALLAVRWPVVTRHIIESAGAIDEVKKQLVQPREGYEVDDEMADRLGMTTDERALVERLRRSGLIGLIPRSTPQASKPVRARAFIAPAAEAGQVHLNPDGTWLGPLLDEVASFPNGVNDDQVDAMSQALKELAGAGSTVRSPEGQGRPQPAPGQQRSPQPVRGRRRMPGPTVIGRPRPRP